MLLQQRSHRRGGHVLVVRLAAVDGIHLAAVQVDADDALAGFGKDHRQRQPDVAQPDDGDGDVAPRKFVDNDLVIHGFPVATDLPY